jgi:hypothetical protein
MRACWMRRRRALLSRESRGRGRSAQRTLRVAGGSAATGSFDPARSGADFDFHGRECQRLTAELERARDGSKLPDSASARTRAALDDLLLRVRGVGG